VKVLVQENAIRVGLIGAGGIARAHLPGYMLAPNVIRLVAVSDIDAAACAAVARDVGELKSYDDARELLASPDVDAVDICTPHDQHRDLAIAAAEAGKHVLLEKPMGCSLRECEEIVEACDRAGVTLMIGQNLRYLPSYRGAKALIDQGALGRVWSGVIEEFLATDASPRPRTARAWYTDGKRAGGGVFITQSTHHIDLFRYFFGEVDRVSAQTWTDHPAYTNGAEDKGLATLILQNGASIQLRASNSSRIERMHFSIVGEDGVIFTDAPPDASPIRKHQAPAFATLRSHGPVQLVPGVGAQIPPAEPLSAPEPLPSDNPFANEIQHFALCCRDGREPISSGRDNLHTMRVIFALYRSAEAGGAWVRPAEL
jgi:predicted dehydrogenase